MARSLKLRQTLKITQNPHVVLYLNHHEALILCLNPQNYPWRKCLHIPRSPRRLVAFTGSISMVTTRPFHASTCRAMRVDLSSRLRTVLKLAPPGTKYQRYQRVEVIFTHPDILWDWKLVYSGKFWHDWRLINEILLIRTIILKLLVYSFRIGYANWLFSLWFLLTITSERLGS